MPLLSRIALGGALGLVIVAASSEALADCYVDSVAGNDIAIECVGRLNGTSEFVWWMFVTRDTPSILLDKILCRNVL